MGRTVSIDEYLNKLSERAIDNTRQLRRSVNQRRNGMEDLYGVCFSANGDADNPATFYISLSPDYVYLQRFAFKFVIKPYTSSVAGASSKADETGYTELDPTMKVQGGTSTLVEDLTPNPHKHDGSTVTTDIQYGIKHIHTTSSEWAVKIAGVDITPYLIAQHDGAWISGEGVYPSNRLDDVEDFYDILEVASVLTDEGEITNREIILASGFKKVEILSNKPFGIDAYLYLKYPNTNR